MTERVKSGLTWRGLETGYGEASEAPSNERDGQQIGFTYETPRRSSTLHIASEGRNQGSDGYFLSFSFSLICTGSFEFNSRTSCSRLMRRRAGSFKARSFWFLK
jgi:hypothetical protein